MNLHCERSQIPDSHICPTCGKDARRDPFRPEPVRGPASLDPGIRHAVEVLLALGVETFESCQGGEGHSYPEPTVAFNGGAGEGLRALAAAIEWELPVRSLRRTWIVHRGIDLEAARWELTFFHPAAPVDGG